MEYSIDSIFASNDTNECIVNLHQLLATGYDINALDNTGYNILHHAYIRYRTDIAEVVLQYGADPDVFDRDGKTLLIRAAQDNNLKFIQLLTSFGTDYELYDSKQDSPLLWASFKGHLNIVVYLIENGANPYHKYVDDRDSLMWAVNMGKHAVTKYLLRFLKDLNQLDINGNSIVDLSKKSSELGIVIDDFITTNKIALIQTFKDSTLELKEYEILRDIFKYYSISP